MVERLYYSRSSSSTCIGSCWKSCLSECFGDPQKSRDRHPLGDEGPGASKSGEFNDRSEATEVGVVAACGESSCDGDGKAAAMAERR
jgi:hypothetical protein